VRCSVTHSKRTCDAHKQQNKLLKIRVASHLYFGGLDGTMAQSDLNC
jgi:hypothetical protein